MKTAKKDGMEDRPRAAEFLEIREELRHALPPIDELGSGAELRRDLWPEMLRRLERASTVHIPWFDWALLATAGAAAFFFPALIPALLYHL